MIPFNGRCTIKRRERTGTTDAWGRDSGEYTYTPHETGVRYRVEGRRFEDNQDNRDMVLGNYRAFFPSGTDVRNTDRIEDEEDETEWDVVHTDKRPGGTRHHVEVLLMVVE